MLGRVRVDSKEVSEPLIVNIFGRRCFFPASHTVYRELFQTIPKTSIYASVNGKCHVQGETECPQKYKL